MAVTADRLSPIARLVVPSFADLLFVFLLATQIQRSLFSDADTGWHLWAGFQALAHGPGPVPDTLSYSRAGVPWISTQWLGEAALALAFRHARYIGVAVLCALTFAGTFAWCYRLAFARSRHVGASLAVTLLCAAVTWTHFLARPVAFAYPGFLGAVTLLARDRPGWRTAGAFGLLTALWANVHPSALLAPAIAALAWIARPRDRVLGLAMLLALLALGMTPAGWSWLGAMKPAGANLMLLGALDEWKSPQFREPRYWALFALLILALGCRRKDADLPAGRRLSGLAWLAASLGAARLAPFAALAWAPQLAADFAAGIRPRTGARNFASGFEDIARPFESVLRPGLWPVAIGLAALVFAPRLAPEFREAAAGFSAREFPVAALAQAKRLGLGSRVLASYDWGGFVEWTSAGRWKTYVDGRAGFFSAEVLANYLELSRLRPGWRQALEQAAPDWILIPAGSPLASAAPLTGRWSVAYRDSLAVVLAVRP